MRVLGATIVTLLAQTCLVPALAADYDYGPLRGTQPPPVAPIASWEGGYVGATAGYTQANMEFTKSLRSSVLGLTRNTALETEFGVSNLISPPADDSRTHSFGAFAGWNWQFEELVFGLEADYTRASMVGNSSDNIFRSFNTSNGYLNEVGLSGSATTHLKDYGTFRARFGYALGSFLPFVTGGAAIGRADVSSSAAIQIAGFDQATWNTLFAQYQTTGIMGSVPNYGYATFNNITLARTMNGPVFVVVNKTEKYALGATGGVGIDWQILPNMFLRAEYQYIHFGDFKDHKAQVNTVRAAAALKF